LPAAEVSSLDPRLLIGILACSHKAKTIACLESLAANEDQNFEVFLIDNGSGEGIGEAAKKFPFVMARTEPKNRGAAAGRNLLLQYFFEKGRWPYLLFMDNDLLVLPDTLEKALDRAQDLKARGVRLGGLGAHIVYRSEPEKYWSAGGGLIDWENAWFRDTGQGGMRGKDFSEPRRLDISPTAFLLVTRDATEETGPFVEDYFIYFEDADWCWRMVKAGFELWSAPECVALHDVSSSLGKCSPQFYYFRTRNRMWFFQAFSPDRAGPIRRRIFKDVIWNGAYPELRAGNFKAAWAVIRGFLAGLRLPPGLRKREDSSAFFQTGSPRKDVAAGIPL